MRTAILMVAGLAAAAVACSDASSSRQVYTPSGPQNYPPPPPASVTAIDLSPRQAAVVRGGSTHLTASPRDENGNVVSGAHIAWASSDTNIAKVTDGAGSVRAMAVGSVVITASADNASATSTIVVNPVPVGSVAVSLAASSIQVGNTTQATAVVKDSTGAVVTDRAVTWSSSAPGVATVSASGFVTALANGSTTITATSEGKSGNATLTVAATAPPPQPVASVTVTLGSSSVGVGATTQASAVLKDAGGNVLTGRVITWSSSNASVASVSSSGVVTALALGSANIIATSEGITGQSSLSVTAAPPPPVATVAVTLSPNSLTVGQTVQATTVLKDAGGNVLTGRTITWASSNTAAATVNATGLVTAVGAGTSTITATSEGINGTATVTVTLVPVASVTVTLNSPSLTTGQSTQATAVTKDAAGNVLTGRAITWSSSNTAVATVSSTGLVQAVGAGTAAIKATSGTIVGSANLTVTAAAPAPVATVTVSPSSANLSAGRTQQYTATLKDASGNTLTGRVVTWSINPTSVATIDGNGLVTAVANGTATVTATSETKTGTASLTVADVVSPGAGVPVYDPSNSDHVLHVFEDWSTYATAADIGRVNRVDGGGPWTNDSPTFKSFTTNNNDPWFGKKTLDIDYQQGPGANQSEGHGLNLEETGNPTRYLNASRVKASLVIEWAWRFSGTQAYVGKIADWQPSPGTDRFNYQLSYDPMGAQGASCNTDPLCSKYYSNNGLTPKLPGILPTAKTEAAAFARSINLNTWFYTQNMNYGTGTGKVSWGGQGETMLDNVWRRTILRLTLNANGVMGQGRLEEWLQVAGQPAVKVMEYVGDIGGFDQGLVNSRDASQGGNVWLTDASILHWYNLSAVAGIFDGGATVHVGYFRMWSQSRQ